MGQRTVESHLSRIYRKLDVRSRTELSRTLTAHRLGHCPTARLSKI
jgi:DNA-binding CsgD family transcriptional regulator